MNLLDAMKASTSTASSEPRIIPLCASWFPADDPRGCTGLSTFHEAHIAEARFFDLDKVINSHPPYPHTLPEAVDFATSLGQLGIRKEDILVVYDTKELGIFSAPKVGWILKAYGHPNVHILNNFRLWVELGFPTERGAADGFEHCPYPTPKMDMIRLASLKDVQNASENYNMAGKDGTQLLDSARNDEFSRMYPDLQRDSPLAHIPGSTNIPCESMLDPDTKAFLSSDRLKKLFEMKGVNPQLPIISSGTSITAYLIETALKAARYGSSDTQKVYDGSWNEWTKRLRLSDYWALRT